MNTFGSALKLMRADLRLSQLDLAGTLGTTQRHVSFLETGRSQPSRDFVVRLSTGLSLSLGQRAALFDASGFPNPYRLKGGETEQLAEALDLLERRALQHWRFPAYVLNEDWCVLRANAPGKLMLAGFGFTGNEHLSLFEIFLSPQFRDRILNWEEASMVFYFRMQSAIARSQHLRSLFDHARENGLFDHIPEKLKDISAPPPYVPVHLTGPDGTVLQMSSLLGRLASIHDAAVEGLEVEFMLPMDDATEHCMLSTLKTAATQGV